MKKLGVPVVIVGYNLFFPFSNRGNNLPKIGGSSGCPGSGIPVSYRFLVFRTNIENLCQSAKSFKFFFSNKFFVHISGFRGQTLI